MKMSEASLTWSWLKESVRLVQRTKGRRSRRTTTKAIATDTTTNAVFPLTAFCSDEESGGGPDEWRAKDGVAEWSGQKTHEFRTRKENS